MVQLKDGRLEILTYCCQWVPFDPLFFWVPTRKNTSPAWLIPKTPHSPALRGINEQLDKTIKRFFVRRSLTFDVLHWSTSIINHFCSCKRVGFEIQVSVTITCPYCRGTLWIFESEIFLNPVKMYLWKLKWQWFWLRLAPSHPIEMLIYHFRFACPAFGRNDLEMQHRHGLGLAKDFN